MSILPAIFNTTVPYLAPYLTAALVLILTMGCAASRGEAHSTQVSRYSFVSSSDYLSEARHLQPWSEVLARHAEQQPMLYNCGEFGPRCRGRLKSFRRMIERAENLPVNDQIQLINLYMNGTDYKNDRPRRLYDSEGMRRGVERNRWSTLFEFLSRGGDCEDYATAKYFALRELGFDPQSMRVVVTYEKWLHGHHAVLVIHMADGEVWLLDSDNIIRKNNHSRYRYLYAMNEISVWDHRPDFGGSEN